MSSLFSTLPSIRITSFTLITSLLELSPLAAALITAQYQICEQLVSRGADVECVNSAGDSLLHNAIRRKDEGSVSFLLDTGANYSVMTAKSISPLVCAIIVVSQAFTLVSFNTTIILQHLAIEMRSEVIVALLCRKGVDVDALDRSGHSAIWVALRTNQPVVAQVWLVH
jgi:ankyrin repeat protein